MAAKSILSITDPLSDEPLTFAWEWSSSKTIARSLVFICSWCGTPYAKMSTWSDSGLQPFSAVHGCCSTCPSNRYYVPGSLECSTLSGWHYLPREVLAYQLSKELAFTESISHPHYLSETVSYDD